ncbi:hypothetical protein [Neobacillus vireti]|uniref:hypothetical protein n=1 Tax=Neobacillus vireti TaxID=220686 RepID=UPI002FFDD984
MFKKIITIMMALILLLICNSNDSYAASYPPAIKYQWTSGKFQIRNTWAPGIDKNGYINLLYSSPTSSNLYNSYIILNTIGKKIYEQINSKSLGNIYGLKVVKDGLIILTKNDIRKLDAKGNTKWVNKRKGSRIYIGDSGNIYLFDFYPQKLTQINQTNGKVIGTYTMTTKIKEDIQFNPKTETFYALTDSNLSAIKGNKLRWKVLTPKGFNTNAWIDDVSPNGTVAITFYSEKTDEFLLQVYSVTGKVNWAYKSKDFSAQEDSMFNANDYLLVRDSYPDRFIWFDPKGNQVKSYKLDNNIDSRIFSVTNNLDVYISYTSYSSKGEYSVIRKINKAGIIVAESQNKGFSSYSLSPYGVFTGGTSNNLFQFAFYKLN